MKDDMCLNRKSQVAHEILAYLTEHPEAQDTLEGIIQWWLLEQRIKYHTTIVKEALAELVGRGLILERKNQNSPTIYRINRLKVLGAQNAARTERQ